MIGICIVSLVFGIICAFYVSVVGFALTALITTAVIIPTLKVTNILDAGSSAFLQAIAVFVAMQVGYFASVVVRSLMLHFSRLRQTPMDSREQKMKARFPTQ